MLEEDYLGEDLEGAQKKLDTIRYINDKFPPSFIMTSHCDFLRDEAEPMYQLLKEKSNTSSCSFFTNDKS